jgi:hypothetical protein
LSKTHNLSVFGEEFQRAVIKLMFTDKVFMTRAVAQLKQEYFMNELKWFFERIVAHCKEHNNLQPFPGDIESQIGRHDVKDQQRFRDVFNLIFESNITAAKIKKDLTGFIRANMFLSTYEVAARLYNTDQKESAYEFTKRNMDAIAHVNFNKDRSVSFGDHEAVMVQLANQANDSIKIGIKAIDDALMGGLYRQTWTTFCGGSNSGKSMLSIPLALNAAMQGKKTYITVHEDEELPTKARFLSGFSGVPLSKINTGIDFLTDQEKEAMKLADQLLKKFVRMRFMYSLEATIEAVCAAARQEMQENPFDLFICDYGQCLSSERFKSLESTRHLHEHVYFELKQLCLELDVAGAGGAQVNRQGHAMAKSGADWIRGTDVAEAFGIYRKSSNFITINRSEADAKHGRVVFLLDKARNGLAPVAVECVSNYSICRPYLADQSKQKVIPVENGPDMSLEDSTRQY